MSKHNKHLINLLKKFPDQNPNPVIRLSKDGILEYFNNPSKDIINYYNFKLKNKISDIFLHHLKETISKKEHSFEIKLEHSSFYFKAVYIEELKSVSNKSFNWKDFPSITSDDSRIIVVQVK